MDQVSYQRYGLELAEHWAGRGAGPEQLGDKAGYYVWNAIVYTVVGYLPLAATLPNAAVAGVSAVLAYKMAGELAGPRAARVAGAFAALFPSLVLWSSLNLKDAAAIATILLALRGAQVLQRGFSPAGLLMVAVGIAGLSQFRNYLVSLLAVSVGLSWLLPRLRAASLPVTIAVWAVLAVGLALYPGPVESLTEQANFETLGTHRRNLALGDSAYYGEADVSTPGAALRFLPVGLAYFLLAPAPWQLFNARQWLTLPEMLAWYALLPQVFFGWRYLLRRRVRAALPIGTFAVLGTLSYALVESNLGTAYRHRAQVLVLYLIFAAVGIATRRERRERAGSLVEAPAT